MHDQLFGKNMNTCPSVCPSVNRLQHNHARCNHKTLQVCRMKSEFEHESGLTQGTECSWVRVSRC